MARKLRAYLDTSVFGGCFDPLFRDDSLRIIKAAQSGRLKEVIPDEK